MTLLVLQSVGHVLLRPR